MSPRVLTARGQHSGKADANWDGELIVPEATPVVPYPSCDHPITEPRIRTLSDNSERYVWQCLTCGRQTGTLSKYATDDRARARCNPPFDPAIETKWHAEIVARREEERAQHNDAWWSRYSAYIASDAWWDRRCRRLELDAYQCQAKLPGCRHHAEQVHHLTYAHLGNEPLFDLISVCTSCHDAITAMDRQRRGTL